MADDDANSDVAHNWASQLSRRIGAMEMDIKAVYEKLAEIQLLLVREYQAHQSAVQKDVGDLTVRVATLEVRENERNIAVTATLSSAKSERADLAAKVWDISVKLAVALAALAVLADQLGITP